MSDKVKWGFIGLGSIARRFGNCFPYASGAEIYAVASRSQEKADAFGAEFGATRCYGSYEALVNDPAVDIVYIGTPHNLPQAAYPARSQRRQTCALREALRRQRLRSACHD